MNHDNTMIIEARGNAWLIFVSSWYYSKTRKWYQVEELIRGPIGYPDGEEKYKALGYAEQEKVRRGIFQPVEVRA